MSKANRNYYNVIKDGSIISTHVTNTQVSELTGCDAGQVSTHANSGAPYKGMYFEICDREVPVPKKPAIAHVKQYETDMTKLEQKEWNYWRNVIRRAAVR